MTDRMTKWLVVALLVAAVMKEHNIYPRPVNSCDAALRLRSTGW